VHLLTITSRLLQNFGFAKVSIASIGIGRTKLANAFPNELSQKNKDKLLAAIFRKLGK